MGWIKNLFSRFGKKKTEIVEEEAEDIREAPVLDRDSVNLRDQGQRTRYVRSCLEQIKDARMAIEKLTKE